MVGHEILDLGIMAHVHARQPYYPSNKVSEIAKSGMKYIYSLYFSHAEL
jgi:hypothetical protein